jgi:hypothetical protein
MYSEPLGIYMMSFWSFPTSHNPYQHFRCFYAIFNLCLLILDLSLHLWDYLCIPHTIVYLSNVLPTLSDLCLSLFIFALIDILMFWLFLIVDRFHWLRYYYMFGLQSLWTISHIQTLQRHFNPSDVTITYTSPTTPI